MERLVYRSLYLIESIRSRDAYNGPQSLARTVVISEFSILAKNLHFVIYNRNVPHVIFN